MQSLFSAIDQYEEHQRQFDGLVIIDSGRVYYDPIGNITDIQIGTVFDDRTNYIEVTEEYARKLSLVRNKVVNGSVITVDKARENVVKLVNCSAGDYATVRNHMSLLIEPGEDNSNCEYYKKSNIGYS